MTSDRVRLSLQCHRMMVVLPCVLVTEGSVVRHAFVGPGARSRAARWIRHRT